jgi:hypothetical protein
LDLDPRDDYTDRLRRWRDELETLQALVDRIATGRFVTFGTIVVAAWIGFDAGWFSPWWLLVPVLAFVLLVLQHDRIIRRRDLAERAVSYYESGIARLEDRWQGRGQDGLRFLDEHHPYAADLDLFGRGSLFELLCRARTRAGEDRLADWLLRPAVPDVARQRQEAIAELRPRIDLREAMALLGASVAVGLEPQALRDWSTAPPALHATWLRITAALLAAATAVSAIGAALGAWSALPFLTAIAAELTLVGISRRRMRDIIRKVERPTRDLSLLSALLQRLEREHFESTHLRQLQAGLGVDAQPPSAQIAALKRRVDWLDARRNELFAPVGALLLWGTQWGLAIEAWRVRHGHAVRNWLDAVAELEALASLSAHAYEHPDDPFAEIANGGRELIAAGIGHPLLPPATCVRNDVTLNDEQRVLIVSGSNMSGKSTLLRSVGTNVVLAMAGAPVRARRLRLSPLALGASLRIVDSLQTGTSHFYAEIKRLRQIVDIAAGPPPLLFLLDEILHGTNSHDRRIGAEAVVRDLVRRGAVGLVTTHDLALARIADRADAHAVNVHFEDRLNDGQMSFDYKMRPGVVTKSNALALMRSVGLDVD